MEFFDLVKRRRSIRKYQDRQIERGDLEKIIQAGLCAPNAGGGQRAIIVAVRNRALCEKIGRLNIAKFNRNSLAGSYVSSEQPSIIDDPSIRSGFYGAPTVVVVLADGENYNWMRDGALVMGNLMNAAWSLGVGSCWINRALELFDRPEGKELLARWGLPATLRGVGNCILGYPEGDVPTPKPRKPDYIVRV